MVGSSRAWYKNVATYHGQYTNDKHLWKYNNDHGYMSNSSQLVLFPFMGLVRGESLSLRCLST